MAIYSATNIYPNGISINAATPNIITWEYQGDGTQTHFQIKIYDIDNNLAHDSTKTSSSNEYYTLATSTLTNGTTYKLQLDTWDGSAKASSNWVLFYCNTPPTLTLGATPTSVQQYEFSALYNSSEGVPVLTYQAFLYLAATPTSPIDESGVLYPENVTAYSSTPLTYTFDGLESGTQYGIRFTCINQRGVELDTGISNFTITYLYPSSVPALTLTPNNNDGTILLNWVALKQILGYVTGTSSYVSGKFGYGLQIDANSILYYTEPIQIGDTTYCWIKFPANYNGYFCEFGTDDNGYSAFFNGTNFGFKHGEFITCGRDASSTIGDLVLIGMKYRTLTIKTASYEEILTI